MFRTGLLFAVATLAGTTLALGAPPADGGPCTPHGLSVSGTGEATGMPGIYVFHVSVSRRSSDVQAASSKVARIAAAAVKHARETGLGKADIQSTAVTISPVYQPKAKPDAPRVYEVRRNIVLTLRDPGRYAQLVEGLMQAGVNGIGHIEAKPSHPRELADKALAAAVADARRKAAVIAKGLGTGLGQALDVQEQGGSGPRPMMMGATRANNNHGYEPGRITVNASVSARFALSPSGCPKP